MTMAGRAGGERRYTVADLEDPGLPATLPLVPDVAVILGVGQNEAYRLAATGRLPVPAWKLGRQWMVPTAHLRTVLGVTAPDGRGRAARSDAERVLEEILAGSLVLVDVARLRQALGLDGGADPAGDTDVAAPSPVVLRHTA